MRKKNVKLSYSHYVNFSHYEMLVMGNEGNLLHEIGVLGMVWFHVDGHGKLKRKWVWLKEQY